MKTILVLTLGAAALYAVARKYNINSVESFKKAVLPKINELVPQLKSWVPGFDKKAQTEKVYS
ncbi:MAG: hypothetical protein H0W61_07315 [Bacteroidetes bacterium]|nr:hypothetical protein [Bacteroidota bacterium]